MDVVVYGKLGLIFLALALAACAGRPVPSPTPPPGLMDGEQQAVYAAALQKLYPASNYVIMDTTATSPIGVDDTASILGRILQEMRAVDQKTADSFQLRNEKTWPVPAGMDLGSTYALISQAEMKQLFSQNQNGWQIFYEQHPGAPGITSVSRVGFNDRFDQALVYIGTLSHPLAGEGFIVLLEKVNGTWVVDQQVMTWIS